MGQSRMFAARRGRPANELSADIFSPSQIRRVLDVAIRNSRRLLAVAYGIGVVELHKASGLELSRKNDEILVGRHFRRRGRADAAPGTAPRRAGVGRPTRTRVG